MPFLVPFIVAAAINIGLIGTTLAEAVAFASLVSAVGSAIIGIGLSLIASILLAPSVPKPADGKIPKRQPIPPRIRAMGLVRLSGAYMLYEASAEGDSYDVLAVHDGLITSVEGYYLHDDLVTIGAGNFVNALADGSYGNQKIVFLTRLGQNPETAYNEIVAGIPSIWTNDHRGDGIASIGLICHSVKAKDFSKIYPNQLPQPSIIIKARPLFDPRVSGQDAYDASTWAWSDNPVLMLLTYLIDDLEEDYATRILPEIGSWMTAASVCDQDVPLDAGGTEKRYRAGGFYQVDNDPADVINVIMATFDGWLGETGSGALKVFAGEYYEPTVTIEANHITAFRVQKFVEDEQSVNEIVFTYVDPEQKFTEVEGLPVRDEADITARGKVRSQSVGLTWVQSHTRGRRLATREMKRLTSPARGSIRTDLFGLSALGERYVKISIPELPSLCTFSAQVGNTKIDIANGTLTFDWVQVDSTIDDWTPATDEGTPPATGDPSDSSSLTTPTGLSVVYGAGALFITFDTPARADLDFAIRYRLSGGSGGPGEWIDKVYDSADTSGPTITVQSPAVLPNTSYDVEVAAIGPGGTYSDYTAPVTIDTTTTAVPATPTGLTASPGTGQNFLAWNPSPAADNVTGFKVYRAAGTGAAFGAAALVATLGVVIAWTDPGRTAGAGYTYFLKATNANGDSGATAGVDCTTLAAAAAPDGLLRIIGGTPGRAPTDGEEFFNALMASGDEFLDASGGAFARAYLECEAAPSDRDWVCTLKLNGSTVATGTITVGSTVGTWSGLAGPITPADADNLTLTGPLMGSGMTLDSTFSGLAFGLFGTRTV